MRMRLFAGFVLLALSGCATFKELEPVPPLLPSERGFIEIKNVQDDFLLQKDGKYFMKFPRPEDLHYYILLETRTKKQVGNYFTATFNDGQPPIVPIPDQGPGLDSLSIFPADSTHPTYFWVIDRVPADVPLTLRYRYVPQWRYTVETKYDEYRRTLSENMVDRTPYQSMGPGYDFSSLNVDAALLDLRARNGRIAAMNEALLNLADVFPANIATSKDTMYARYRALSADTKDELAFQAVYDAVLTVLQHERQTEGSFSAFVDRAEEFGKFLGSKDQYRKPIVDYLNSLFVKRLEEAAPIYDGQIAKWYSLSTLKLVPNPVAVLGLYRSCGADVPDNLSNELTYAEEFNTSVAGLQSADKKYAAARSALDAKKPWPDNSYYRGLLATLAEAHKDIPTNELEKIQTPQAYGLTDLVSRELRSITKRIADLTAQYAQARDLVDKINEHRTMDDYRGIVQLLRDNRDLSFVIAEYPDIDELMLKSEVAQIRASLDAGQWRETENGLANLQSDRDFLNPSQIASKKNENVKSLEGDLFDRVKKATTERAEAFAAKNAMTLGNIPALYADSAFLPVYVLTFSSESQARLLQKRRMMDDYLNQLKYVRFPESAIRPLYRELTRAPEEHGVEEGKAILAHARFYTGTDKTIRSMIDECNPATAKQLVKPKDYRRIIVLPVNDAPKSSNEYMFRINVRIPSDARFPVYDIDIKVPKEVAEKSATAQWFSGMTLNKKAIKTEGHMRITAPSADNEYEAQITPVQVEKDKDNIIEVTFKYSGYKVLEFSAMAQEPLIRKN